MPALDSASVTVWGEFVVQSILAPAARDVAGQVTGYAKRSICYKDIDKGCVAGVGDLELVVQSIIKSDRAGRVIVVVGRQADGQLYSRGWRDRSSGGGFGFCR